ncbi:hypothetical protein ACHAPK_000106, partial [Fusarium culmorum]
MDVDQFPVHENGADDQNAKNAADSINYDTEFYNMPMHLSITTTTVEADFHLAKDNKQKMISYRQDAQLKHWDQTTAQVEGFVLPNTPDPEHIYSSIAHRCDIVLMNHEGKKNKTKGTLRVTAAGYVEYHSRLSSLTTMHQLSTIPRLSNYGLQVMINDPWGALL